MFTYTKAGIKHIVQDGICFGEDSNYSAHHNSPGPPEETLT